MYFKLTFMIWMLLVIKILMQLFLLVDHDMPWKKNSIIGITQLKCKQTGKASWEIVICLCGYQVSACWQNTWDNYHGGSKYLFLAHVLTSFRTLSIGYIASDLWYMMQVSRTRESLPISPYLKERRSTEQ